MNKGDFFETIIEDVTTEGAGLGRVDGLAVFVPNTIPGDRVKAQVTKLKKNYVEAKLVSLIEPSEDRIDPACPYADRCGGCALQNMDYSAQLRLKQKQVRNKLERIGGIDEPVVRETIGMDEPYKYRNKGEYPAFAKDGTSGKTGKNGKARTNESAGANGSARKSYVGFYERKSHLIVDVEECMLQSESADAVTKVVRRFNRGEIKQVIVRTAYGTGEVMVILECKPDKVKYLEELIYAIDDECPCYLESVYALTDGKYKLIAGKRTITDVVKFDDDEEDGEGRTLNFEISAPSFYQVNTEQMIKLYNKAEEYANLSGEETLLDIYCGIGTIGLSMADRAKQVIGIELVKEAVIDANRNATINGIVNARYICGKAEEVLPICADASQEREAWTAEAKLAEALAENNKNSRDSMDEEERTDEKANLVAILDPPRAGCDEALLKALADASVSRIVYISCDPATLERDVKYLGGLGYEFIEATPVDMFPWTGHVETVVKICREKRK